jgi:putative mRNA 3-end processing factor
LAEEAGQSLLYTGDFKLGPSATAEPAELPHAEILVIESTYGDPAYRLPPRDETIEQFLTLVRRTLADEAVPVVEAYALGKGQEVTRILTGRGIPVLQHRKIFEISRVYESFGVDLGRHECLTPGTSRVEPGWAVVVPPGTRLHRLPRQIRFAVTGWAVDAGARYRLGVDHAIPLSDHADFDGLVEAVARVAPRIVYCTHGPATFVDRLLDFGYNARVLGQGESQGRLF